MKKKVTFVLFFLFFTFLFCSNMIIANAKFQDVYSPGCNTEPFYVAGKQWGLEKIQIESAWPVSVGRKEIKVGVLDTGIDISHGDLNNCVDRTLSKSFLDANEMNEGIDDYYNPLDYYNDPFFDPEGHGTHVAGIIAANSNNEYGIVGVAPNTSLVALKVADINGDMDPDDVAEAILYAEENDIEILNYSAGGKYYQEIEEAIKKYTGLFVCGAGNVAQNNDQVGHYPSNLKLPNLISVGASDENDNLWRKSNSSIGSNYGLKNVDLFAPGSNIISTYPIMICNGTYRNGWLNSFHDECHIEEGFHNFSGTSMATPFVTGVAALLLSSDYSYTPQDLKSIIMNNVDKIDNLKNYCVSGGRLNAERALASITHTHNIKYRYFNERTHKKMCTCGITSGETQGHYVLKAVYEKNPIFATCLGCKARLDFRKDYASVVLSTNDSLKMSSNGSYILPSGIVVLVEEDLENYMNGTLIFFDGNEI